MKTLKTIFVFCLLANALSAQPYMQRFYFNNSAWLTDGNDCRSNGNAGFMMASINPTVTGGNPRNFYIQRTDVGGDFTGANWQFDLGYDGNYSIVSCNSGTVVQVQNMVGVSLIETSLSGPTRHYALAGTFDDGGIAGNDGGAFFSTLTSSGTPVAAKIYRFPAGFSQVTKPIIVESTTAGQYFIAGSYSTSAGGMMYILKVNQHGQILISKNFEVATSIELEPRGMIISPYASELVVVGRAHDWGGSGGFTYQGFFSRFNISNLNDISTMLCGQTPVNSATTEDWYSSISVANSMVGGNNGFVIGGHSDFNPNYYLWVLKVDQNGNAIWNNLFLPVSDNSTRLDGISVFERYSSYYSAYNYYAAVTSTTGMMVAKLDDNGSSFTSTVVIDQYSEFVYEDGGSAAKVAKISFLDNAGGNDIGLHVYGTSDDVALGDAYFVEAAFNGFTEASCMPGASYIANLNAPSAGPSSAFTVALNTYSVLTECADFTISITAGATTTVDQCYDASLPNGGSLNRAISPTKKIASFNSREVNIYPNPTNGKCQIELNISKETEADIKLYDSFGRFVSNVNEKGNSLSNKKTIEVDLKAMGLPNGIYFLVTDINGIKSSHKLIYCWQ